MGVILSNENILFNATRLAVTVDAPERKKALFYYPGQLILYRGEDDDSVKK